MPVLSEQMTEVQPSVSTEGSERTMAFFLAMRRVPRARQVVMTAGRPEREREKKKRESERENETDRQTDKLQSHDQVNTSFFYVHDVTSCNVCNVF